MTELDLELELYKNRTIAAVNQAILRQTTSYLPKRYREFVEGWPHYFETADWPIWRGDVLSHEVEAWCDENFGPDHWDYCGYFTLIGFEREKDAMLFKMRWQ